MKFRQLRTCGHKEEDTFFFHATFRKGKDTLSNFSFRAFHEIQFQGHFIKYEILS